MDEQTALRVIAWYFHDQLGQEEIANRLGVSRSSVSRLIARARERGLVDVRPRIPGSIRPGMASFLAEQHGLRDVVIVPTGDGDPIAIRERLGRAAACYFQTVVRDTMTIGISWGTSQIVEAIGPAAIRGARVVQLAGGLNPVAGLTPLNELVQRLAARLGATPHYVYAPAVADTAEAAATFRAETGVARALGVVAEANVALFGVGDIAPGAAILDALTLDAAELARLRAAGAVGTACVRFFDAAGCIAAPDVDNRAIGASLSALAAIPNKIVVAGERRKQAAVRGALAGRLVDVLVTDESLALTLLADLSPIEPVGDGVARSDRAAKGAMAASTGEAEIRST